LNVFYAARQTTTANKAIIDLVIFFILLIFKLLVSWFCCNLEFEDSASWNREYISERLCWDPATPPSGHK
jgi:hypothetical protein